MPKINQVLSPDLNAQIIKYKTNTALIRIFFKFIGSATLILLLIFKEKNI